MLSVQSITDTVFAKWSEVISDSVNGSGHYSYEQSQTISKFPYATLYFMGLPGNDFDLEGNEASVTATLQIDIYDNRTQATNNVYIIDVVSHLALINMGFRRTYGPEFLQETDSKIKRLTSRYSRLIGYGDDL